MSNDYYQFESQTWLISLKYEGPGGTPSKPNNIYGGVLWKLIIRGEDQFFSHAAFEAGDGSLVFFWRNR